MARRSMTLTATTRRRTRDLPDTFDDLIAVALRLAVALDDPVTSTASIASLSREWRAAMDAIGARIAADAAEQRAWGSTRPKAV